MHQKNHLLSKEKIAQICLSSEFYAANRNSSLTVHLTAAEIGMWWLQWMTERGHLKCYYAVYMRKFPQILTLFSYVMYIFLFLFFASCVYLIIIKDILLQSCHIELYTLKYKISLVFPNWLWWVTMLQY